MESPEDVIGRELSPGERLLWSGRPPRGLRFRAGDLYLVPFALCWTAVAVFALVSIFTRQDFAPGAVIGVPFTSLFVVAGVYLSVGRFWVDAQWRRGTCYGVTSERVVVVTALSGRTLVHSLVLRQVAEVQLTVYRDGGGLIGFGTVPSWWYTGAGWPTNNSGGLVSLDLAADSRMVYEFIRGVQHAAAKPAEPGAAADGGA
ncbi:hypothetical protein [Fimbriiglobus ruber]|uniref:DUF304 domain-containing protein n=1 Tax=Fimbriiglobus ruber TaxID=1908690 RepID=A0A225EB04_9BACT|nr:hypothetical protein [Fimbriiglobus ruber]OWK45725.1 hypothetical protein FRUB_02056 [Fimbriiglobus ruber]